MVRAFPFLLRPHVLASRNRARRRQRGDLSRGLLFGGIGVVVCAVLFRASAWLAGQLTGYAGLGDYLLRLGLSWLFLPVLFFLPFRGLVPALSAVFFFPGLPPLGAGPAAAGPACF